jgi:hypothetical protein
MATKTVKVTLTEKNDAGPLFDLFFSINSGSSFTSSDDSTNLYLPYTGASAVANVDELANAYDLRSKGVCVNSQSDIVPTPTPTATTQPTPTPTFDPSIPPTPTPTATLVPTSTPVPGPTPTPSFTSFAYHSITKSFPDQFKCVWSSSSQAYQAYAMIQYLTGQSSPTQSTPYYITAPSVKIWDSLGTERVDINSTGSSTVLWYYDGIQVVVEWNDVSPTGTYANGSTYSDTWGYQKD